MGLSSISFSCCCLPKLRNSDKIRPYSSSRSSKVINLGVNRKLICDFLLLVNSNFGHICYRFRDTDATPPLFDAPARESLRISRWNLPHKTRGKGLIWCENFMILYLRPFFVWITRVTDGQTNAYSALSVYAICCRAQKKLIIITLELSEAHNSGPTVTRRSTYATAQTHIFSHA